MSKADIRVESQIQDAWDYFVAPPGHGSGVAVAGRVDPELKHMMSVIVQSGQTKFDTESDLIRSALHWFVYDKFKKFHGAKLDRGIRVMVARVAKAQHAARAYDAEKFKNTNRDALLKLWAIGAKADAVGWFGEMLSEAREVHDFFGREIKTWAFSDPALVAIVKAWRAGQKEEEPAAPTRRLAQANSRGKR